MGIEGADVSVAACQDSDRGKPHDCGTDLHMFTQMLCFATIHGTFRGSVQDMTTNGEIELAIEVHKLTFAFPQATTALPALKDVDLVLPRGAICILVGSNGAGGYRDKHFTCVCWGRRT